VDESFSLLAIIGFLVLSAFFSGAETAFFSLSKIQLKKLEKTGSRESSRISRLLNNPRRLLILILFGNTIVNVAASTTATLIAISLGEKYSHIIPDGFVIIVEIVLMTLLLLVFGEITPKLLAFSSPEKYARQSSLLLEILYFILWPAIIILNFIGSLFSGNESSKANNDFTSEDLKNLIKSKVTEHSLEEKEKEIIASIFRFSSTYAREIMIPRVDIIAVEASDGLAKVKQAIIDSGHSKIPIYKKNIDNVIGVIYAKDIILQPDKKTINSLLRPILYVTENLKIQNLMNQFKSKKIQISVVVDEYGGTAGLLTLEDILEELVGDIMDEYDKEKPRLVRSGIGEYIVSGMYAIAELNEEFHLEIDEDEYDNIAEFLYDNFNRVPQRNETFVFNNRVRFTISTLKGNRIIYAKMKFLEEEYLDENQ